MQWTATGELAPKKVKTDLLEGKVLATVFWDHKGLIFIEYREKCRTVTGP